MFDIGSKVKIDGIILTVRKVRPGEILLRGWGTQKWFDIEKVKSSMEKGIDLK